MDLISSMWIDLVLVVALIYGVGRGIEWVLVRLEHPRRQ